MLFPSFLRGTHEILPKKIDSFGGTGAGYDMEFVYIIGTIFWDSWINEENKKIGDHKSELLYKHTKREAFLLT